MYVSHLSLTEQQGSINSSLAATLAGRSLATLFRYTMGVLPAAASQLIQCKETAWHTRSRHRCCCRCYSPMSCVTSEAMFSLVPASTAAALVLKALAPGLEAAPPCRRPDGHQQIKQQDPVANKPMQLRQRV